MPVSSAVWSELCAQFSEGCCRAGLLAGHPAGRLQLEQLHGALPGGGLDQRGQLGVQLQVPLAVSGFLQPSDPGLRSAMKGPLVADTGASMQRICPNARLKQNAGASHTACMHHPAGAVNTCNADAIYAQWDLL